MAQVSLITKDTADRIKALSPDDVDKVLKLASLSLSAGEVVDYARRVSAGETPEIDFSQGSVKPITVQAWSLVHDKRQYNGTYGLSSAEAADLRDQLETDPSAAVARITTIVSDALSKRGSPRSVKVALEGMPRSDSARQSGRGDGDGGASALSTLISRNAGVYGSYVFDVEPTGRPGPEAFRISLGGNLAVYGQSKKVCVAAARLVRVHGRRYEPVLPYVKMVGAGAAPRSAADIKDAVWDGILIAGERQPRDASPGGSTISK